jgi:hypothetical protein
MQIGTLIKLPHDLLEQVEERVLELRRRTGQGVKGLSRTSVVTDAATAALEAWLALPLPPEPPKRLSLAQQQEETRRKSLQIIRDAIENAPLKSTEELEMLGPVARRAELARIERHKVKAPKPAARKAK